jgi:SH3-like domain-containing protein
MRHLAVLAIVLAGSSVRAEPARHTTEAVTLRKKPGEKEAAVAKVAANTAVIVLGEEGRWLKVKVKGAVGYLTRTTVSDVTTDPVEASTWSAGRRTDDGRPITELFVEAPNAGALTTEPKPNAPEVAGVAKGERLIVLDAATPGWLHARDDHGHEGWIATGQVENGATAVEISGAGVDLQGKVDDYARPPTGSLALRAEVGIGYRSLGMDLSSNADGGLTNYLVDADAAALVFALNATRWLSGKLFVAGDVQVVLSQSRPGIAFSAPDLPPGEIPFETFATDAGLRVGLHAKQAIDLALRAGGRYDTFLPDSVDNKGMLPRERLLGVTLGARVEILPPHSRFGASLRFDVLAIGSRSQTAGLEDGTSSTARGLWGGVTVRYQLGHHVSPFAGYDFGRATTSWTGMSVREPQVTSAYRVDITQLIQIGIGAEL